MRSAVPRGHLFPKLVQVSSPGVQYSLRYDCKGIGPEGEGEGAEVLPALPRLLIDRRLVGLFAGECRGTIATIYDQNEISY